MFSDLDDTAAELLNKVKAVFITPDKVASRLEWETRFLMVDYICAWLSQAR